MAPMLNCRKRSSSCRAQVLVTVPSRVLLEQFAEEMPSFCKVGMGYNKKIDFASRGFISVTDSVQLLKNLKFEACFVDEGHHPLPPGMPLCKDLFKFSATHKADVDFRYSLGEAIAQSVLSDYDLTVPVTTDGHPYICLANLLLSQAGRFRRVLAYCNSVAEAERFQQVLETVGLAAWHINGKTRRTERERVMDAFSGELQELVHVLVTVQVLGEGVNIPNADTCMFVEPRDSYVSIIQAIGRVLRPHPSKPMAHIVLPAIAMPATSRRAAVALPGLSDLAGASQTTAVTTGSVEHIQSAESEVMQLGQVSADARVRASLKGASENSRGRELTAQAEEASRHADSDGVSKVRRSEPAQNELLASGGGLQAARLCTQGHATQWAEGDFKGRGRADKARALGPCDSRSSSTSMTRDRHRAELVPPSLPAPLIPMTNEEDTPSAMPATRMRTSATYHHATERVQRQSSLTQYRLDSLGASTGPVPASMTALEAAALASCKRAGAGAAGKGMSKSKSSWDAAPRGSLGARRPSAVAPNNQIDTGAGPAGLCEGGGNGAESEFSDHNSQSQASLTDGVELRDEWSNDGDGALQTHPTRPESVMVPATVSRALLAQRNRSRQLHEATASALQAAPVPGHHGASLRPSISIESTENLRNLTRRRASKLKVKATGDSRRFAGCHADQLDRFLQAITQADSRLVEKDIRLRQLQCRVLVMDSRLQQPNMPQLLARDVLYRLALVLQRRDAWDLHLQAVENFDQEHGRLPRQIGSQLEERTLGKWLHNAGYNLKKQKLSAERVQKLLNSSCSRVRARCAKWLESDVKVPFQLCLEELRQFVHAHRRMPGRGKARPMSEKRLLKNLLGAVKHSNRKREKRLQLLENIDPIVADWVKSAQAQKIRVHAALFCRQLDRLVEFVGVNERLPQRNLGEVALYDWLCRQRRQLDHLPAQFQTKLFDAHPAIAVFLES